MIARYSTPDMTLLWSDESKFQKWLKVELAVLEARSDLGLISKEIFWGIKQQASFSKTLIEILEKKIGHDLLAFVESVQIILRPPQRKYFHAGLTSYDVEEPASSLMTQEALHLIITALDDTLRILRELALRYKYLPTVGRTHGQHAEPITLGLKFLNWYEDLFRQLPSLHSSYEEMGYSKITGAVGTYGTGLSPEIEKRALEILGLCPARISRQILLRDRQARLLNTLSELAGVIENMATNIRLLAQTEIGELQEPFGVSQKGSSRLPHKINTVLSEQLSGLASVVRGYAGIMQEHIVTWQERDISHSSVERIILPDAFQLSHYMIKTLTRIMEGVKINKERIKNNLELTQGAIFSPEVKELLMETGMDTETAYRVAQSLAREALGENRPYLEILLESRAVPADLKKGRLQQVFNLHRKLVHIDAVFKRFGL